MKILGIIPARGGSKGIKRKNIKLLGRKPLIQYTIESAKASRKLSNIILSSDDQEIITICNKLGLDVPFVRPEELAKDDTPTIEVIKHALDYYENREFFFDAVCLLQPTTPFRNNHLIDRAINSFFENDYDSSISVREVPSEFNPHWVFENHNSLLKLSTGEQNIISRRQELPKAYHRDGAVYLTKTEVIKESNSLFGEKIGFVDTSCDPYVNIDAPSDWETAENILKNYRS